MPQGRPMQGEFYRHFKNKMYQIVGVATHSETREKLVIYQALYGNYGIYARPYDMFISEVDHEKYPEVEATYRFTYVDPSLLGNQTENTKAVENSAQENEKKAAQEAEAVTASESGLDESLVREYPDEEVDPELKGALIQFMKFLDTDSMDEKYKILIDMRSDITDQLIDNMAASLDFVIDDGPLDKRYEELLTCVRTRQRFETNRFR
ncbi:Protein of unknown function [Lachnospiraceae bacterium A10]|nr:Protein of unknown function [Lachnospiraceae bacterium A10]